MPVVAFHSYDNADYPELSIKIQMGVFNEFSEITADYRTFQVEVAYKVINAL